jgi:hypothetical protein
MALGILLSQSVMLIKYAITAHTFSVRVSDSKIKEGIFVVPQIRALIRDGKFKDLLSRIEKSVWTGSG